MEDSKIIDLYWNRDEQAIAKTRQTYGDYCRSIVANILRSPEDVEEDIAAFLDIPAEMLEPAQ